MIRLLTIIGQAAVGNDDVVTIIIIHLHVLTISLTPGSALVQCRSIRVSMTYIRLNADHDFSSLLGRIWRRLIAGEGVT